LTVGPVVPRAILLRAAEIIEAGWCQHEQALARHTDAELAPQRAEGLDVKEWFCVSTFHPRAERFCMGAAIRRATWEAYGRGPVEDYDGSEAYDMNAYLQAACARAMGLGIVWFYNDSDDVTQSKVAAKLRELAEIVQ
jgi:hypothetical protein